MTPTTINLESGRTYNLDDACATSDPESAIPTFVSELAQSSSRFLTVEDVSPKSADDDLLAGTYISALSDMKFGRAPIYIPPGGMVYGKEIGLIHVKSIVNTTESD